MGNAAERRAREERPVSTPPVGLAESTKPATSVEQHRVVSRRFGTFDIPCDRIFRFPEGLIGFPEAQSYVLLDHRPGSPFKWMLSIENPELAFAVADPAEMVVGYSPPTELAARALGTDPLHVVLFAIVTIPKNPLEMTLNLMAPIAVDLSTKNAVQMVLDDPRYEASYLVVQPAP